VQVSALSGITVIDGGLHSLALKNDGTVWAWGMNLYGQLGNGTNTDSNVPVQVTGLCQIVTGMEEDMITTSINIFPNPVSDKLTVQFSRAQQQDFKIILTDLSGRIVVSLEGKATEGINQQEVDLKNISQGTYIIHMKSSIMEEYMWVVVQ
jgi:hypothetical protein